MQFDFLSQAKKLLHEQKKFRHYLMVCLCLGAVVGIGTVAALRMSGKALTEKVLDCQYEVHEHTDDCYTEDEEGGQVLVCGYADYVVHTHGEECYGEGGDLLCLLPEVSAHEHTDDCYEDEEIRISEEKEIKEEEETEVPKTHEHTDGCYTTEPGELICEKEEHKHTDACYESVLNCEEEGHKHSSECYEEDSEEPVCGEEEFEHEHTDSCYEAGELICEKEEHEHTDSCYEDKKVLICTEEEEEVSEKEEESEKEEPETEERTETVRVLVCGEQELHTHDDSCYEEEDFDEDGNLREGSLPVCGLLQLEEHIHTEDCFKEDGASGEEAAEPEEEKALTKEYVQEQEDRISFKVIATYDKDAEIPEDAELVVEPLTEDSEEAFYEERLDTARELSGRQDTAAELLYNIGFYVDGKEIEPKGTVNIEFQMYQDGIEAGAPVTVVHFGGDEPKVLESTDMTENEDGSLSTRFDSDSFSPFALIVGGQEESLQIGVIGGEQIVYTESDKTSDSFRLKEYEPQPEEAVRIKILETIGEEAAGEELWYRYAPLTEDEQLAEQMKKHPYIPAADVILEENYVKRTLTATDERGVMITVEGFLPQEAELTVTGIYNPDIASLVEEMKLQADNFSEGDFRRVYDIDMGLTKSLPVPVMVSVSNIDLDYKNYNNLSTWVYCMHDKAVTSVSDQMDDNGVNRLDAEITEEGDILFQADEFSIFYVAMELMEGREEYFASIAEQGDQEIVIWEKHTEYFEEEETNEISQMPFRVRSANTKSIPDSKKQNVYDGGEKTQNGVTVSKTLQSTDLENVFDITLQVKSTTNIQEFYEKPDMAVVIVMDISNTMKDEFGNSTRYTAAMDAAESFIKDYGEKCKESDSKLGFVAFNTHAHKIFGLKACNTIAKAGALVDEMKQGTEDIIYSENYGLSHDRFTNIEGGLKCAYDMLKDTKYKNKMIVFLSDGFPTTYLRDGSYNGYDPYEWEAGRNIGEDGVFWDGNFNQKCEGTSYSDTAAIKARKMASSIKNDNIKIYSIGIDIGGQKIGTYLNYDTPIVECTADVVRNNKFEIGSAYDVNSYVNWLATSIGSGYSYYKNSTDYEGLKNAFNNIFTDITKFQVENIEELWTVTDPMSDTVEFIALYDKEDNLKDNKNNNYLELSGSSGKGNEKTAVYKKGTIKWDLKKSGYTTSKKGNTTVYTYTLKYRVRLKNEEESFKENSSFETNKTTTLTYRTITTTNDKTEVSPEKTVDFRIPQVKGYLSEFQFQKIDRGDNPVENAEFTLKHDPDCKICRGDGSQVKIDNLTAKSMANGIVRFANVPSGHQYLLNETKVPDGYVSYNEVYRVTVAYDNLTTVDNITTPNKVVNKSDWKIVNAKIYKLPKSGGPGTEVYTVIGVLAAAFGMSLLIYRRKIRGKRG